MKIKELLKSPCSWTTDTYARNKAGEGVPARSKKAYCWCLLGAINVCYPTQTVAVMSKITDALQVPAWTNLASWNDSHTHAEVLALVEKLDL